MEKPDHGGQIKVAETIEEFRAAFAYNLLDENKRRFAAETAFLVQWDDHETRNNWYPEEIIGVDAYKVKSASLLSAYARQAMFEYNPMRFDGEDAERVYRRVAYGPALDVFMLDERSYRGPNSPNRQPVLDQDSAFLGAAQLAWLKRSLLQSTATWKLIASDMPISIVVPDLNPDVPKGTFEAWANADNGPPTAASWKSRVCCRSSRTTPSRTSYGLRPMCITRPPSAMRRIRRNLQISTLSGNSSPGRSTPAPLAPARWT